jgi:hypothetical protein
MLPLYLFARSHARHWLCSADWLAQFTPMSRFTFAARLLAPQCVRVHIHSYLVLLVYAQEGDSAVTAAMRKANSTASALSFDAASIAPVASRVSVTSAGDFCGFINNIAYNAEGPGCDVIVASGVIPLVFALIARHITVKDVVYAGCWALYRLAEYGSADVRKVLIDVTDCETILKAAQASGFDKTWDGSSRAAKVLKKLGL